MENYNNFREIFCLGVKVRWSSIGSQEAELKCSSKVPYSHKDNLRNKVNESKTSPFHFTYDARKERLNNCRVHAEQFFLKQ